MIICFNCSTEIKKIIDILLKKGQYNDYTELISVAISNLSVLHEELVKNKNVVIELKQHLSKTIGREPSLPAGFFPYKIPEIFNLPIKVNPPSEFKEMPKGTWVKGKEIPLTHWIFGQYNKLLPAKANCRALVNILKSRPYGVDLEEASKIILKDIAILGSYLSNHDEMSKIDRDNAISTAFPLSEVNEKSLRRYSNQFLGDINSQGRFTGLLFDFKLINYVSDKTTRIFLTEIGWEFGTMENPVLDNFQENPSQKFSNDEIDFLLSHIHRSVPAEDFAYRLILQAINAGSNRPESLDDNLEKLIPKDLKQKLKRSFISSQRYGVISRMSDLGLVKRVRNGVKVSYEVSEKGTFFLKNVG